MTDPDRLNQMNYRTLLQAMGRPGRIFRLQLPVEISSFSALMAVADCLLDPEVGFAVSGNGAVEALQNAVLRRTGGRVSDISQADYVFFTDIETMGLLGSVKHGDIGFPEDGATVIYHVHPLKTASSERFRVRLRGPGIPEAAGIAPEMREVTMRRLQELAEVNAEYPLGVDAVFIRPGGEVMCIPRSTRIALR